MKTLALVSTLATFAFLTACGSDDNTSGGPTTLSDAGAGTGTDATVVQDAQAGDDDTNDGSTVILTPPDASGDDDDATAPPADAGQDAATDAGVDATVAPMLTVTPQTGYLGQEVDVVIAETGASLPATAALSFGTGIVVTNIHAGTTAGTLAAHLSIDPRTTALGSRTVTATSDADAGSTVLASAAAYSVTTGLTITSLGAWASGRMLTVGTEADLVATTQDGGALQNPVVLSPGFGTFATYLGNGGALPVIADFLSAPGATRIVVEERNSQHTFIGLRGSDATVSIAAPTGAPTDLTPPKTNVGYIVPKPGDTSPGPVLPFKMGTSAIGILSLSFSSAHRLLLVPPSGRANDALAYGVDVTAYDVPVTLTAAQTFYAAIFEENGGGTATTKFTAATITAETTTPHACTAAQALSLPAVVSGQIAGGDPVDCFRFNLPAGGVSESLLVTSTGASDAITFTDCNAKTASTNVGNFQRLAGTTDSMGAASACQFSVSPASATAANATYVFSIRALN